MDQNSESFGELTFDAELISPEGKELLRSTFTRQVRLADRTFLSLAKVLSQGVAKTAKELKMQVHAALSKKS